MFSPPLNTPEHTGECYISRNISPIQNGHRWCDFFQKCTNSLASNNSTEVTIYNRIHILFPWSIIHLHIRWHHKRKEYLRYTWPPILARCANIRWKSCIRRSLHGFRCCRRICGFWISESTSSSTCCPRSRSEILDSMVTLNIPVSRYKDHLWIPVYLWHRWQLWHCRSFSPVSMTEPVGRCSI